MPPANNHLNKNTISSLLVCRGCLATDARLYDMRQNRLMEAYSTLLNTALHITDELPHYLCSYCAALLLKCDTLRNKCIDSQIVLTTAQKQYSNFTTDKIKRIDHSINLKHTVLKNIDIVDENPKQKQNYADISLDTDESIDYDLALNYLDSEKEKKLNLKAKSCIREHKIVKTEYENAAKNSNNELKSLLNKYFDNERCGLLKDFTVNIDNAENKAISNIREDRMNQLSEIIKHIQYSSETSNELLRILDEDPIKSVNKTNKESKVVIKQSKCNSKFETINEQKEFKSKELQEDIVQDNANKSVLESQFNFKAVIEGTNSNLIQIDGIKLEISPDEISRFELENQYDDFDEILDSEDDIAIADLKLNIKPSKCKNVKSGAPNYRGCKNIINGILKGRQTKKMQFTEELYAMYNTEVKHLSREEQIKEINDRKDSDNYKNGQFKCNICFKGFLVEETYQNHMSLHHDISGKFVCDICHCHFMTKRRLFGHKKGHTKLYTCKECGHITRHGTLATEHYRWHSGKRFSCKDCGKEFRKKSSKYGHIKMCHPTSEQLVRCEICGDSFNGLPGLKYHDNRAHKEMYSPECYCSGCNTQFYCSDAFKAHQGADGLCITTHKHCVRCGMSFETEQLLKEHEIEQRKSRDDFDCEVCHKRFKFFWKFKMHQRRHSATYPNYIKMYNARKMKTEREEYGNEDMICEVCGKSVKNAGLLKLHYSAVHSDDKPFKCTVCPKGFKTSALLVGHMRVHTGERPYQCQNCPKAFQNPQNLKRHNLVHTGERPHSCDICGKSFQSTSCVKTHVKTVHMKIPMPPRIRRRNKKTE